MKRLVATVALVLAIAATVDVVGDLTQSRPEPQPAGSVTTVAFTVSTRSYRHGDDTAVLALWALCAATVPGEAGAPAPVGDAWEATISPALGETGRTKLTGCLEDHTLDRVLGHVVGVRSSV